MSKGTKVPGAIASVQLSSVDRVRTPALERLTLDNRFTVCGIVKYDGDLQVDGHCDADILCKRLFVGETASIDGVITAGMVEVFGELKGEVYANLVILRSTAHVEAELNYRALELDPGSYFEGRSRRTPDPMAESPSFDLEPEDELDPVSDREDLAG